MSCNCGQGIIATASSTTLAAAPATDAETTPDNTVVGQDGSQGGTVPFYGSPGGAGTAGSGGGYTANGSEHATGTNYTPTAANQNVKAGLGGLSAPYESGSKGAGAIGYDGTGGYSYGTYQIATNTGTMNNFMKYLQTSNPTEYSSLCGSSDVATCSSAAQSGTSTFQNNWTSLAASDSNFATTQQSFIQSTHYDPAVSNILTSTGLNINSRSLGVQNAVWSTAVQCGPNSAIFTNANLNSSMSDTDIINALYDERGKTTSDGSLVYFSSSTPAIQSSVANRLVNERQGALSEVGNST